ncbi:MAG: hypothetical protein WBW88_15265 [Rhodothermales bacterium]
MNRRTTRILCATAICLAAGSSSRLVAQDNVQAAACDGGVLNTAASKYDVGLFDRTIGQLKPCFPNGFEGKDERIGALRLLALSYIVTDSLEQARSSIRQLVKADRKFQPDLENDPPLFADMVQRAKPAWYTWFYQGSSVPQWIGRAAIVGTAVSLPFLLKGNTVQPLPEPPALPN